MRGTKALLFLASLALSADSKTCFVVGENGAKRRARWSGIYPVFIAFHVYNVTTTTSAAFWKPQDPRFVTAFLDDAKNCPLYLRCMNATYYAFTYGMFVATLYVILGTAAAVCDMTAQVCAKMK